jgi:hypothetical protein
MSRFPRYEYSSVMGHQFLLRPYWWVTVGGKIFPFSADFGRLSVQWNSRNKKKEDA